MITELQDCLQRPERRDAVVFLLAFGQLFVSHQAGVEFLCVVALGAVGPALSQALCGPEIVRILGQAFGQGKKFGREVQTFCCYGARLVVHAPKSNGCNEFEKQKPHCQTPPPTPSYSNAIRWGARHREPPKVRLGYFQGGSRLCSFSRATMNRTVRVIGSRV